MRAATILLLALQPLCFGSEISGTWGLSHRNAAISTVRPVAIQLEQTGNRLLVLKILQSPVGRYVEHKEYTLDRDAAIRSTPEGTTIRLFAPEETWIIDARGALTINPRTGGPWVLEPAGELVQISACQGVVK